MKTQSDVILDEVGDVEAIVHAACVVEAAERGGPVSRHDLRVQLRAADIVMSLGAYLRSFRTSKSLAN